MVFRILASGEHTILLCKHVEREIHAFKLSARYGKVARRRAGEVMAEIYIPEEDIWSDDLRQVGFYIGKFIYLMAALDDVEKDKKSGNYNPFLVE